MQGVLVRIMQQKLHGMAERVVIIQTNHIPGKVKFLNTDKTHSTNITKLKSKKGLLCLLVYNLD